MNQAESSLPRLPVDAVVTLRADVALERPRVVHVGAVAAGRGRGRALLAVVAGGADVAGHAVGRRAAVGVDRAVVALRARASHVRAAVVTAVEACNDSQVAHENPSIMAYVVIQILVHHSVSSQYLQNWQF